MEFLLSLDLARKEFFREFEAAGQKCVVFEREKLLEVLSLREFWQDSETERRYKSYSKFGKSLGNKIGLFSGKKFLKQNDDVVLSFPFKDCVLKGAQNRDDQKSDEVFFNEIIAKKEIDVLFSSKAIGRFELNSESGATSEHEAIQNYLAAAPNLLIKANNLIALHSIVGEYRGKVKCIYIDPPYNTGNDSFCYNDKFTHSAYLCFMKNRLEIAREFLSDDGVIFIQCDDNEQAYLKVLCDEVFGRGEFVGCLPRVTKKAGKSTDSISKNHDYILAYKKANLQLAQLAVEEENYPLKDEFFESRGAYKLSQTLDYDSLQYSKTMDYEAEVNGVKFYAGGREKWLERQKGNFKKIDWVWRWSKEKLEFGIANRFVEVKGERIYTKTYLNATISKTKPYTIERIERGKNLTSLEFVENQYSNDMASKNIQQILNEKNLFNYPKPEALLKRIIEISTRENDLILDFFAGSGTTLAVAHKMGRRYIGIEQMDYIETITKERLKKVIAGEQGGISKVVGWKPQVAAQDSPDSRDLFKDSPQNPLPDSPQDSPKPRQNAFLYLELMPFNAVYKERIQAATSEAALEALYGDLREKAFLDYRADLKKWLVDKDFKALNLADKKRLLAAALDENMDYVLYADMEDPSYGVDAGLIALNKLFYKTQQK